MSKNPTVGTHNHIRFSDEVIQSILDSQPSVPVTINFKDNAIGQTNRFELDGDKVICTFQSRIPDLEQLGLYAVPMGMVTTNDISPEDENGIRTITSMKLLSVSICTVPADQSLSKLEKEKSNES